MFKNNLNHICYLLIIEMSKFSKVTKQGTTKFIIVHCKHEGCYEYNYIDDEKIKARMTSIRINPPKLFVFDNKEHAAEFFDDYISDVDVTDKKCMINGDVEHVDYCTCGIVELNEEGQTVLFYNKTNQIFLTESCAQFYEPNLETKQDINNMNLSNRRIRMCRRLSKEQRLQYIELGRVCQECEDKNNASATASASASTATCSFTCEDDDDDENK
jgi:hypothetical protein